ncbi:hypothetical protein ECZU03_07220 [Escherichia coli]|nr:hypothetical protein ECZU03_07220 [Escherichia coli]
MFDGFNLQRAGGQRALKTADICAQVTIGFGSLPGIGQRLTLGHPLTTITGTGTGGAGVQPTHNIRQSSVIPAAKGFIFIK